MKIETPAPLYPTFSELKDFNLSDYPQLKDYLNDAPDWRMQHWRWGADFLKYIGRNKSEHTYTRFRNDVERFLLWAFNVKQTNIDEYRKADILDYIDFCVKPPPGWISDKLADRFLFSSGCFKSNKQWRPFRVASGKVNNGKVVDKKKYKPSQQTITSTFVAIKAFYTHLMEEEICYGNPVPLAKRDCKYLIKDSQVKSVNRLSEEQWSYVMQAANQLASKDPVYERNLFIVATMKTLFLRVSELSERHDWIPVMSHFWQDQDQNWWFKAFGKGKKIRDISVPPDYLDYLKRYRAWRGLASLPYTGENTVLVEKLRGQGGVTSRQITRLVQEVFDRAYLLMAKQQGEDLAQKLRQASTHYLRHTGASMEIERDRPLKDVSEDLGHASSATTDTVYVQVERKRRARSGRDRKVE